MENHEYSNRFAVTLNGCDDSTTICMFLPPDEQAVVEHIAAKTAEVSRFSCMPTLTIRRSTERDERDYEEAKAEAREERSDA